jgi:hypothetical protein
MSNPDGEVTQLLKAMKRGDAGAGEKLLPLVYAELHRLARSLHAQGEAEPYAATHGTYQRGLPAPRERFHRLAEPRSLRERVGDLATVREAGLGRGKGVALRPTLQTRLRGVPTIFWS